MDFSIDPISIIKLFKDLTINVITYIWQNKEPNSNQFKWIYCRLLKVNNKLIEL